MAAKKVAKMLMAEMRESRSPLYRWLRTNYADIKPIIDSQARPAWQALARTAAESGLGKPSRQAVRKAWLRLDADMTVPPKSKPASVSAPPQPAAQAAAIPSTASATPNVPASGPQPKPLLAEPRRNTFQIGTLKKDNT
jgi:hypothetical protein